MAFTSIPASITKSSKAITQSLMELIRTNFDDHEARIVALEAVTLTTGFIVGESRTFRGSFLPAGFLFEDGSSVSETTFADLFAVIGTDYGSTGPGFFNLPDARGRVDPGKDDMDNVVGTGGGVAGRITVSGSGIDGTVLGAAGGGEGAQILTAEQNGPHDHAPGTLETGVDSPINDSSVFPAVDNDLIGGGSSVVVTGTGGGLTHTHPVTVGRTGFSGDGDPHRNVQPSLMANKIIRFQ